MLLTRHRQLRAQFRNNKPGFAHEQMFSECDVRAKLDEKRNVRALQFCAVFRPNEFGCGDANDSVQWGKIGSGVSARDEANRAR